MKPHKAISYFSTKTLQVKSEWHDIHKVLKVKKPTTKITLPGKVNIQNRRKDKEFSKQAKTEGVHHH